MKVIKKIYADGRIEEGKWDMELEEMQEFVGGYIEQVLTTVGRQYLIVNEDGLRMDLAGNVNATKLVHPKTNVAGLIRGNALLVKI